MYTFKGKYLAKETGIQHLLDAWSIGLRPVNNCETLLLRFYIEAILSVSNIDLIIISAGMTIAL